MWQILMNGYDDDEAEEAVEEEEEEEEEEDLTVVLERLAVLPLQPARLVDL